MTFLTPYFLIGLVGLAVPILIHLWSRNTRKSVEFGSVRFLLGTETRTMRSISPSQLMLLLLRLLLVTLFVFLMSELVLNKEVAHTQCEYFVDPEYGNTSWITELKDSTDSSVKWLSLGYPEINSQVPAGEIDHWLLTSSIQSDADEIVVITPRKVKNYLGRSRPISQRIRFFSIPVTPIEQSLATIKKGGEVLSIVGTYDEWATEYARLGSADGIELRVTYQVTGGTDEMQSIFRKAFSALDELTLLTVEEKNKDPDWLINLSGSGPSRDQNIIFIRTDQVEKWQNHSQTVVSISSDWDELSAAQLGLPSRLLELLASQMLATDNHDQRTLHEANFTREADHLRNKVDLKSESPNFAWILLMLILGIERALSYKTDKI